MVFSSTALDEVSTVGGSLWVDNDIQHVAGVVLGSVASDIEVRAVQCKIAVGNLTVNTIVILASGGVGSTRTI